MPDNKCRWKSRFGPTYECNEPALPDDPDSYCILHSKNEDKDLDEFIKKGTERIEKGTEEVDLRGCYFPKKFPDDYFRGRTFDKPVYFTEATFSQADFSGATFSRADFLRATFSQADFSGATFSQADFRRATFSQEAVFRWATFSQADFGGAAFSQEAYFSWATFSQEADFGWATFSQKADFGGAKFSQWAAFSGATFSQEANFLQVKFMGRTFFQYIHISGEVIFQDVDLSHCSFLHSNIDKVDFRYCTFAEKGRRRNVLMDELDCDIMVKTATDKKKAREEGYEPVRRVYLELKRNFEDNKDWNTAGDFHFGEMECRRKIKGWLGRNIFSLEALYFGLSGYGERPRRAFLILSALVFMVFPLLYMYFESKDFYTSVEYSFKASTLMRFGSVELQNNWSKFFSGLEFILIPLQTALLALALRRKVKR